MGRILRKGGRLLREGRWKLLGTDVIPLEEGGRLRVRRRSELGRIVRRRRFEAGERDFTVRFLRPGDVYVDVGANIGLFTVIAGARVGPGGRVIAFEPSARTYDELLGNVRLNGLTNVTAVPAGLSSGDGTLTLHESAEGRDAWNSFAEGVHAGRSSATESAVVTWDGYASSRGLLGAVALMKIDVEGWEERVLKGGREVLSRPDAPVLQVEFTPENQQAVGSSCARLAASIRELGYELFEYSSTDNALRLEDGEVDRPHVPFTHKNLYGIKDLRAARDRLEAHDP